MKNYVELLLAYNLNQTYVEMIKKNKLKISILSLVILIGLFTFFTACKTLTKTQKVAGIGAVAGGSIGALIGKKAGNTAIGAVIGGAIGGTAGAYIGRNMDKQAKEIEQSVPGAEVIPAGEGIIVKFASGILFATNKYDLVQNAKENISNLANSLNKYPNTDVMIIGHTDSDGSDEYNMALSLNRADAVKNYAELKGVNANRLKVIAKGESEPIETNLTVDGKANNRRVEIVIVANKKLKDEAKAASLK
jgi:outer membrane protein OmpA-like peptidoglycan-associated protein